MHLRGDGLFVKNLVQENLLALSGFEFYIAEDSNDRDEFLCFWIEFKLHIQSFFNVHQLLFEHIIKKRLRIIDKSMNLFLISIC